MTNDAASIESTFSTNLRKVREALRISQEQLAKDMSERGYSWQQATVYKVETGKRQVQLGEAKALADILEVSVATMMEPESQAAETARLVNAFADAKAARFEFMSAYTKWKFACDDLQGMLGIPAGDAFTEAARVKPVDPSVLEQLTQKTAESIREVATETVDQTLGLKTGQMKWEI